MSYHVWAEEGIPKSNLIGKVGYTPEYIQWNGVVLSIPEKEWFKIPEVFRYRKHEHWRDRVGVEVIVTASEIADYILRHYHARGVIVLDHEPSADEKEGVPLLAHKLNLEWRRDVIQRYEDNLKEKEATGIGRVKPTPYEDECYEALGFPKPYSTETLRDQRRPGEASAERIAQAIAEGLKQVLAEHRAPKESPIEKGE